MKTHLQLTKESDPKVYLKMWQLQWNEWKEFNVGMLLQIDIKVKERKSFTFTVVLNVKVFFFVYSCMLC